VNRHLSTFTIPGTPSENHIPIRRATPMFGKNRNAYEPIHPRLYMVHLFIAICLLAVPDRLQAQWMTNGNNGD
jgi:hypothetical protein